MPDWRADPDTIDWEIPFSQHEMPADLPSQWVDALEAVAHDLNYLRVGAAVDVDRLVWRLELNGNYWISIGLSSQNADPDGSISSFVVGRGFALDASAAQCTVWTAETVQTELAGYSYVQWPSTGGALFTPTLIEGLPRWVTPVDRIQIPIGALSDRSEHN